MMSPPRTDWMPLAMRRLERLLPPPGGPIMPSNIGSSERVAGLASKFLACSFILPRHNQRWIALKLAAQFAVEPNLLAEAWVFGQDHAVAVAGPIIRFATDAPQIDCPLQFLAAHCHDGLG